MMNSGSANEVGAAFILGVSVRTVGQRFGVIESEQARAIREAFNPARSCVLDVDDRVPELERPLKCCAVFRAHCTTQGDHYAPANYGRPS